MDEREQRETSEGAARGCRADRRRPHVRRAVVQICERCGTPRCPERAALISDIVLLARKFSASMKAPFLNLRLDVVRTNSCRKFHIDSVTVRLICAYRGPGTQYGISEDGRGPRNISSVPAGSPIILRGTLWSDRRNMQLPHRGLLHRSPPIEGTGTTRLLLVLEPGRVPGSLVHPPFSSD